jgi:glycosyltransferase involved in cell wall biosynthesis
MNRSAQRSNAPGVLVLVPDAFGGRGGIAQFNRDLLRALAVHRGPLDVVALPRIMMDRDAVVPPGIDFQRRGLDGKARYVAQALRLVAQRRFELVICGHINLLPLAVLAARRCSAPLILVTYGIEAWEPRRRWLSRRLARGVDHVVSISQFTLNRFLEWSDVDPSRCTVIPCCVDLEHFSPGATSIDLITRLGLAGKTVLLTVARLVNAERYKGIDEVLEVLPSVVAQIPSLAYVIVGDGPDRARLAAKAAALGLADRVLFTGYVSEHVKIDHYRVADLFAMPGRGEGFGIVYLEAMACGVPVIASTLDASCEAVRHGALGAVVDPTNLAELRDSIVSVLQRHARGVPPGLEYFSTTRFRERWSALIDAVAPHVPSSVL